MNIRNNSFDESIITPYSNDDSPMKTMVEGLGQHTLTLSVVSEKKTYGYNKAHNIWSMVSLSAMDTGYGFGYQQRLPVDFVVVIDVSASMSQMNKLAGVLATLEYMIDILTQQDRFSLVQFSDEASVLVPLLKMDETNKKVVIEVLHQITARGNTNLSDGLFTGLSILEERIEEVKPISRLFLLTDGLANRGLVHNNIIERLQSKDLPSTLTIHCFGYGPDHDPSSLQEIAFTSSGGLYYFVEDVDSIAATFGECIAGTFSTVAYNIKVELEAFDGCRFIQFRTKYPRKTIHSMKYYTISLGSMYEQEKRTIIMRQSLRAMSTDKEHQLFRVTVTYMSTLDRKQKTIQKLFSVNRAIEPKIGGEHFSIELDKQINRVNAADAIDQAIKSALENNFGIAKQTLRDAAEKILRSPTSGEAYCADLVDDLRLCYSYVENPILFKSIGNHKIHSYSTMYHQERAVGLRSLENRKQRISSNYGYCTKQQLLEVESASKRAMECISGYVSIV